MQRAQYYAMNPAALQTLLEAVQSGEVAVDEATRRIAALPYDDLGFARVDLHRAHRQGVPEVVFCKGKTPEQVAAIVASLHAASQNVLATRATPEHFAAVQPLFPALAYYETARIIGPPELAEPTRGIGDILILSAGTADASVAQEALLTARACGARAELLQDLGVAGLHRLLVHIHRLRAARVLIVVAGMEGALPSVVGGLVAAPVIAVPTSVGYGASFGGIAALLGMLNSCASNVTVVNIDNGFGAGYVAAAINRLPAP
jgi:pyridinium-3,5-biscarboxylic acid mononucleotide synthase